ncbi:MAG: transposase zinc-binding domain-containing protein [Deltaproteobacteria bacterium]|nr:transposase zinc-binding domain-containing protein [Deltaproteobacteria bacterium]
MEDKFEKLEHVYHDQFAKKYGFFRPYIKQVIYLYLASSILKSGFALVRCGDCGHEYLLDFSCKRRHFCLFCQQERVA